MTSAEAIVAALVVTLCVAVRMTQSTLHPGLGAFLAAVAVLASAALVLRRLAD